MADFFVYHIQKNPTRAGPNQEYGLVPGRISYYAGGEFSVLQESNTAQRIVGERGGLPVRGDKRIITHRS